MALTRYGVHNLLTMVNISGLNESRVKKQWSFIRGSIFFGNLLEKLVSFLVSKLGDGPLLEHGHLSESWL